MTPFVRAAGAFLACGAALISCGTAPPGATSAGSATSSAPTGGSPTATPVPSPTGTAPLQVERDGIEPATVTGVRIGRHPAYDRVVVDLDGDVPGYTVRWVRELEQDGSGRPIDLNGGHALHLRLTPADAHTEDGVPTWTGTAVPPSGTVTAIAKTGDFEGVVGIALLTGAVKGFEVRELTGPPRLVVDVAH
ncbi:hypothetical protein OUY22_06080 [Nonomuraea sp. MCN248]|uniref:AMIN-like domain-containing protein n=1 Tax=Nonomuraea corallina TaxID=2989783 RepID=A0ABT4S7Q2_9ACTN|nr:hypothetical protein [Nonomuraea corallina]MDA0632981.1 hypothetical protein [Nonomuraea corallina]